jgi:uncharacterized protein (TIGR03546 family)
MILWLIRMLIALRRAISGRRHPRAMAAGLAFGLLLGLVPKLNLTAGALLFLVLCLNLNHAVCFLTAIGVSFLATRLDPFTGAIGAAILESPSWRATWESWYAMPGVHWFKLHNTVVLGSLLVGAVATGPTYLLTVPWLKRWAARQTPVPVKPAERPVGLQPSPRATPLPHGSAPQVHGPSPQATAPRPQHVTGSLRIEDSHIGATRETPSQIDHSSAALVDGGPLQLVETQIDLVRLGPSQAVAQTASTTPPSISIGSQAATTGSGQGSQDALKFLVRHVISQRQGRAA